MKTAIYGGSFNPPHLGHADAAMAVYEELSPDRFFIIPDNVPPHKKLAEGSPDGESRLELCRLNFAGIPGAEVLDIELLREGKSYTADTVEQILGQYPGDELYLVLGTDMLLSFEHWYKFGYLVENCTLCVLARDDEDFEAVRSHAEYMRSEYGAKVLVLHHEPLPMSSSDVREKLVMRMGEDMLDDKVYSEIIRKGYYDALPSLSWLREKAFGYVSEDRIGHVAGCESEAVMLAMHWGEDPETAATAGILHDITKKLKYEEQLILCDKYGIICDNAELENPRLLHAVTGAAMARELFGVSDEVYEAIRWHTTGKADMSRLEEIIYLADYIEPTRDFEGLEKLRELAYEDLDEAMRLALEMCLEEVRSRGTEPHKNSVDAYHWYCNKKEATE